MKFQFPSNGKAETKEEEKALPNGRIMFQFPSNGKAYPKSPGGSGGSRTPHLLFQFPSNGKAETKEAMQPVETQRLKVSIPFKRESVSKEKCLGHISERDHETVSIPFKRESVSKANQKISQNLVISKFQFPSNGKAYPKLTVEVGSIVNDGDVFQFPSNGKAYPKRRPRFHNATLQDNEVSIPFKRESVSKDKVL